MRKLYTLLFLALFFWNSYSQVSNDICTAATNVGVLDNRLNFLASDSIFYDTCYTVSNLGAVANFPYYFTDKQCNSFGTNKLRKDVWYKFKAKGNFLIGGHRASNSSASLDSINITYWRGSSCASFNAIGSYSYVMSATETHFYDTIFFDNSIERDSIFYMQITGAGPNETGVFDLCLSPFNVSWVPLNTCIFFSTHKDFICFSYTIEKKNASDSLLGSMAVKMDGGNGPYSFLWSDGNTDSARTNVAPGKYYVTITDAYACSQRDSVSIFNLCKTTFQYKSDSLANYTFNAMGIDTITTKKFLVYVNNELMTQDSTVGNLRYRFYANGSYNVCMYLHDETNMCFADTCFQIYVTATNYKKLLSAVNVWQYTSNFMPITPQPNSYSRGSNCGILSGYLNVRKEATESDTIINGLPYLSLYDNSFNGSCKLGYIREDTLQRKVYFLEVDKTEEQILYDFGLNPGDSVLIKFHDSRGITKSAYYKLESISNIDYLYYPYLGKVYSLKTTTSGFRQSINWIEGIGSMYELLYPYGSFFPGNVYYCPYIDFDRVLTCFHHEKIVFLNSCVYNRAKNYYCISLIDSCNYDNTCGGIDDFSAIASLDFFPNPTQGDINIKIELRSAETVSIEFLDMQSRKVSESIGLGKLGEGLHSKRIPMPDLPSGIYFIECSTSQGKLLKKIVVN